MEQCMFTWFCDVHSESFRDIPYLVWWGIWLQRNKVMFEGKVANGSVVLVKVVSLWKELGGEKKGVKGRLLKIPSFDLYMPWGFFDGASQQ